MSAPRHALDALYHLQAARNSIASAREASASVTELAEVWTELNRIGGRIFEVTEAIHRASQAGPLTLEASHSGVGCRECQVPEPHGRRRTGGAS